MATWAGGWDGQFGQPYALIGQRANLQRTIAMAFERRGDKELQALAIALNGAAAGSNATATVREIEAVQDLSAFALGGKRNVVTKTLINRNTTAADETLLDTLFNGVFAPTSYPTDKGGGGGGKLNQL